MSEAQETKALDPTLGMLSAGWKGMVGLGAGMVLLGLVAMGMAGTVTLLSVLWFGVLTLVGGIAQLVDAFKYSGWKAVGSHVLLGVVYLAAGFVMIVMPVQSAWWLTLLLGAVFVVTGLLRIVMGVQMRTFPVPAAWLALSGAVSLALGIMIYAIVETPVPGALTTAEGAAAWFQSWGWVIGLFIAIELVAHGVALAALGLAARPSP